MQFLTFIFYFTVTLFLFVNVSHAKGKNATSILVDQSGKGHFKTVQEAIDSIPSNNNKWTIIHLNPGTYKEKVQIPKEKPYIILRGKSRDTTVIEYGDYGNSMESSTFKLFAENFMARGITFTNTYDLGKDEAKKVTWAPAALIQADKASFFGCGFVGIQDTLADLTGRHYFKNCYIEGSVDFIWGYGQSLYEAKSIGLGKAYITAQGREREQDTNGFVFKNCRVTGSGPAYLGRAYRSHARVVFYQSTFDNIIAPEGWDAWHNKGKEGESTFAEVDCQGPGTNMSKRVKWEKTLSSEELEQLAQNESLTKTIVVDQSGKGQFTTVQQAIDSIPSNNKQWTIILLNAGVYKEKVMIVKEKPYIILKGIGKSSTVIEWGDSGNSMESSTFKLYAPNFMARDITFKNSVIHVNAKSVGLLNAYITAQGRESDKETNGFVFKYCTVTGTGPAYLGRAYKNHSTVVFYRSTFDDIIAPEGWDAWYNAGKEESITYAEVDCYGPGANKSKRVKWEKKLSSEEMKKFIYAKLFLNQDNWIEEQLKHV
ncbi:hypothetical protein ACB092_03G020100 [Castanea dentata]